MKEQNKRRSFLKKIGFGFAFLSFSLSGMAAVFSGDRKRKALNNLAGASFKDDFAGLNDRVWIGENYWAIPMEDWKVKEGRIEFTGKEKYSRVNVLTTLIGEGQGEMMISADLGLLKTNSDKGGMAGFSVGIKDELDPDVKAACYFGEGIKAGISTNGYLFIADQTIRLPKSFDYSAFSLKIKGKTINHSTRLSLICNGKDGSKTEVTYQADKDVSGLIALVNNFEQAEGDTFWFRNLNISGSKIKSKPENSFGPILWSMYTLSRNVLKISAQLPPLSVKDNQNVELYFKKNNTWQQAPSQKINKDAFTAHFTIDNWDPKKEVLYQLVYRNNGKKYTYDGAIRKEPLDRPLRFGGLTCQHDDAYPYSPLVRNLKKHDPDLLYFSGDQLYESNGGYPIKRQPQADAMLSYLGKWFMFGWTFGDIMRDRPTICTPDDHDVFQGNLWGEGGKRISFEEWEKARKDAHGGYVQTPEWVNVVALTQCGHMPAPFHSEPLQSGIKTWYTDLLYARVSFAVISDRMFKSGPEKIRQAEGRIDHIKEPLRKNELEDPGLKFLGDGQIKFLEHWINDWQGADMKVLLSQTLFANTGTHHGPDKMFLYGDMDSGGWPKQKRDDVLRLIRKSFTFHINGDQHLPFLVQYSLDKARDAGWTFSTPAISTGYIRWGEPDSVNSPYSDRPAHGLPNTGCYRDVFGNTNYIYAVGNPKDNYKSKNRYQQAQNKASGFGIITFDTNERTIKMEAFRFLADKDKPTENDRFPGWPLMISQSDNDGRNAISFLPKFEINKADQLVKIISEATSELVNVVRVKGSVYQPGIYEEGTYTVIIGEGQNIKEFKGIKPSQKSTNTIKVNV